MADAGAVANIKLKVFISYSRKDEDFAQELLGGMQLAGFEPYLDKHDIAAGEDWEARLGRLIEAADTVVFVISPDAFASERCAWEVERTVNLKKRLLPVVWRRVEEAQVPPRLKQLNYIFFDLPAVLPVASITALATALRTDVEWVREHTRLGEMALRWDGRGRNEALLLRGDELAAAQAWLASPPQYAPDPALLHYEFIRAGEDAEAVRSTAERQRLEQMAAVQSEREKALEREKAAQTEREKALQRERAALNRIKRAQMTIGALSVSVISVAALAYFKVLDPSYLEGLYNGVRNRMADAGLKPTHVWRDCASDACPEMVLIPPGEFMMGSPDTEHDRWKDEGPQRKVTIGRSLLVSKFEVTFAEWDACNRDNGCQFPPRDQGWGRGKRPVMNISWSDVQQYLNWISIKTGMKYRLLTEAEWEYAARGITDSQKLPPRYAWGDEVGVGNANCNGCKSEWDRKSTAPVGSFKANAFGLYDMHGNVWEWVADCYGDYPKSVHDGTATPEYPGCKRIMRGGAWDYSSGDMRAARRVGMDPASWSHVVGFRVARDLSVVRSK